MRNKGKSWLVIGRDGKLGSSLLRELKARNETVFGSSRKSTKYQKDLIFLDLEQDISNWQPPEGVHSAFICAAISNIRTCEENKEKAAKVNFQNTSLLARRLIEHNIFTVFPSSNMVFDGSIAHSRDSDITMPTTEYGKHKAEIEKVLLTYGNNVSIVRFSKIVNQDCKLIRSWIKRLKEGKHIHPAYDMVIAPVSLSFASKVLLKIGKCHLPGILQLSAKKDVRYSDIAYHIADRMGAKADLVQPVFFNEISTPPVSEYRHTTLDVSRIEQELGITAPDPLEAIEEVMNYSKSICHSVLEKS